MTASSSSSALKEDPSDAGNAKPETKAVSAATKNDTEEAAASAPALAIAAKAPQSAALAAANSAVSDSGGEAAAPTISPRADDGSAQADASETATASAGNISDEPASSAETAGTTAQTTEPDDAADKARQKRGLPLFNLFSSNRAGKQADPSPVSSRDNNETAVIAAGDSGTATAPAEDAESSGSLGIDETEVASIDDEHEEHERMDALPGVRLQSLYGFSNDDADGQARIELASAAGMGRFSSGFLVKQQETVQTACLKPALLGLLKRIQYHYNSPVMVTSGYRGKKHNRRVGGVRHSKHLSCEAADIQVAGVSKWELAKYVRSVPGRGGVGTYCYTDSVHVDIGEQRDWNWRCRRRK